MVNVSLITWTFLVAPPGVIVERDGSETIAAIETFSNKITTSRIFSMENAIQTESRHRMSNNLINQKLILRC